jgi:hypothetical protein
MKKRELVLRCGFAVGLSWRTGVQEKKIAFFDKQQHQQKKKKKMFLARPPLSRSFVLRSFLIHPLL